MWVVLSLPLFWIELQDHTQTLEPKAHFKQKEELTPQSNKRRGFCNVFFSIDSFRTMWVGMNLSNAFAINIHPLCSNLDCKFSGFHVLKYVGSMNWIAFSRNGYASYSECFNVCMNIHSHLHHADNYRFFPSHWLFCFFKLEPVLHRILFIKGLYTCIRV